MQANQIPAKFSTAWASSAGGGYIRTIPAASQQSITPGAASLADGFPPVCFLPVGSGGIPPAGTDFNGILNQITAWNRWQAAGATVLFDSTFAAAIGGYPRGAIVLSTVTAGKLWLSTVDGNTTDPDSAGAAGWVTSGDIQAAVQAGLGYMAYVTPGTYTFVVPSGVTKVKVRVWGAGGGSSASSGAGSYTAGAGGGGYAERFISGLTPGQSITVTVGAGGTAATAGNRGGPGGTSSFGAYASATGGAGADPNPSLGVSGGFGTGGDINIQGQQGSGSLASTKAGDGGAGGGGGGPMAPGGAGGINPGNFPGGGSAGAAPGVAGAAGAGGSVYVAWGGLS